MWITDFGLARALDDASLTRTGFIAGTPHYMSPEQARGETVQTRSDLFGLGSVLYFMLTGRPPFRAERTLAILHRICNETHRPVREVNPDIPLQVAALLDRLLEKDPAKRFSNGEEVRTECLRLLLLRESSLDRFTMPMQRQRTKRIQHVLLFASLLLGLMGSIVFWNRAWGIGLLNADGKGTIPSHTYDSLGKVASVPSMLRSDAADVAGGARQTHLLLHAPNLRHQERKKQRQALMSTISVGQPHGKHPFGVGIKALG